MSKHMNIPEGHQAVMPYLMIEGGATKFIDFTQKVFDAVQGEMHMLEDGTTVMYGEVKIQGATIMFSDASEQWKKQTANMFTYVDNADETYKKALEHGATSIMEPSDQSYGRSCGVTDQFGNVWWITSIKPLE